MSADPETFANGCPWNITPTESFADSLGKRHDTYELAARANLLRIIGSIGNGTSELAEGIVNAIMADHVSICAVLSLLAAQGEAK